MSKVLLVSLGSIGQRHLRNTRELLPEAEIAVYRTHFKTGSAIPDGADHIVTSMDKALSFEPDAVILSSPASAHVSQATEFIKNGTSLFIEKPLSNQFEGVQELAGIARQSDCFTMVGYVLRFQPIFSYLKQYLAKGDLGEIKIANVQVGQYLPDWRPNSDYRQGVSAREELGGGALLELSHELDYSSWLFGFPNQILCSSGTLSDLEIDVEDSACLVMEYGLNRLTKRVVVQVDFLQRVANMSLQIVGSKATLFADLIREKVTVSRPGKDGFQELPAPHMAQGNEMYLRQFDFFFANSIEGYRSVFAETASFSDHVDIEQAARVMKLVDSAKHSAEIGSRIVFDA